MTIPDDKKVKYVLHDLLIDLLKYTYYPTAGKKENDKAAAVRHRHEIEALFKAHPSLRYEADQAFWYVYQDAVEHADEELRGKAHPYPFECPWTLEQVLDPSYFPGR